MKRLYVLVPTVKNATDIVGELHNMGITENDLHVLIKNENSLTLTSIPKVGILHTTDVLHALSRGALVGAIAGFTVSLIAINFPPGDLELGGGVVIGLTIFGTLFGAWVSSLIGISIPNPAVEKFNKAVEAGGILMLVDIPNSQQDDIMIFMKTKHPESTVHGLGVFEV